jgi:acetylornithine deacetylase
MTLPHTDPGAMGGMGAAAATGGYVVNLLRELVRINSVNPVFASRGNGPGGEGAICAYLAGLLRRMGLSTQVYEAKPGRTSVVATLKGSGGGRSLMLNGHVDTVGFGGMKDPLSARIENGRLYGRGSYDMKAGVAASIAAVKKLIDSRMRLRGDVVLALVCDEEDASLGTDDVVKRVKVDGAIVTEPTGGRLALAHRGFSWIRVTTHGFACHGSRFDLGIDANMMMGRYLAKLADLERDLRARRPHKLAGPPSLHAPLLSGGQGPSIYSPSCTLQIERRTIPGEQREAILADFHRIAEALRREDETLEHGKFNATVEEVLTRGPFEAVEDSPVASAVASAARTVVGAEPERVGVPYWTDAAILCEAGVDVVVYGADGAGAHEDEEYADLESTRKLSEVLFMTAAAYCA